MSEFTTIFSGELVIPEACRNCPRIRELIAKIATNDATIEHDLTAASYASPRTTRRVTLGDNDSQRKETDQKVEQLFEYRAAFIEQCQTEARDLTSDCTGPMSGELSSKLGPQAIVTLCGSATIKTGEYQETADVVRGFSQFTSQEHKTT